jgi:hypothetical protein
MINDQRYLLGAADNIYRRVLRGGSLWAVNRLNITKQRTLSKLKQANNGCRE